MSEQRNIGNCDECPCYDSAAVEEQAQYCGMLPTYIYMPDRRENDETPPPNCPLRKSNIVLVLTK